MERKLPLALQALLLRRNLVVSLDHDALCKQLLLTSTSANLLEGCLSLVDKASSESAEANLHKSSVEQNLAVDIECVDGLLQMRH